jgi:hypothetical protein
MAVKFFVGNYLPKVAQSRENIRVSHMMPLCASIEMRTYRKLSSRTSPTCQGGRVIVVLLVLENI